MSERIGVFLCDCDAYISDVIEMEKVVEKAKQNKNVIAVMEEPYLCTQQGVNRIKQAVKDKDLDGAVIAACGDLKELNLKQKEHFKVEHIDLRKISKSYRLKKERSREEATLSTLEILETTLDRLQRYKAVPVLEIPITKRAMVIGGGIAGMQAAIDIANAGYEVYLVEKNPSIGGRMAQLSETFPTLDCTQCIMTPKMVEIKRHENIKLLTNSSVEEVRGYAGNFTVKIRKKATYVNWDQCTGCGMCTEKCPSKVPSEFNRGLGLRRAISTPFPQAVPNKPTIDAEHCLKITKDKCSNCEKSCPVDAIDYAMKDKTEELKVGAIVVATGYELMNKELIGEYGYGEYKDVIDSLQFERLLSASGPTAGEIRRPSDGKIPKEIVFIQCAGSRDQEHGVPYCSTVCCMYTAKHAMLYKHRVHDGQAYVFYMDIRAFGKGYEEFVQRAIEEDKVLYIRGRVSRLYEEDGKLVVWGFDTLSGKKIEIHADLVVLAMALLPSSDAREIARKLGIKTDEYGFITEANIKLKPLETSGNGIYVAGTCQGPRDIPDTVSHASGAASRVIVMFSKDTISVPAPIAVEVEELVKPEVKTVKKVEVG